MPNQQDGSDVAVVVPAAGEGRRLGGRRKQFRQLGDKPLLVQTLLVFERHPGVHRIYVAAPHEAVVPLTQELEAAGVTKLAAVVPGGASRQASVAAALRVVPDAVSVVLVHDAVRPFVRQDEVSVVIEQARVQGAAALAIPVTDTLRRGMDGVFCETVPREALYRMQTPQGFLRAWLAAAHEAALRQAYEATDDVDLVQRIGRKVALLPGSAHNVKITTVADWTWAVHVWPLWEASVPGEAAPRGS